MTNEEKAKEISGICSFCLTDNTERCSPCAFLSKYTASLRMAEWKDEQFAAEKQALIDKACEWLENIIFDKVDALLYDDNDIEFVKTVSGKEFADIFRKAMEETKTTLNDDIVSEWQELIVCKCQWEDYYDYRIMTKNGSGHVRVSFFYDEICISDLFVDESCRKQGIATALLNKVDELLGGRLATITPLQDWCKDWYAKRGYTLKQEAMEVKNEKA